MGAGAGLDGGDAAVVPESLERVGLPPRHPVSELLSDTERLTRNCGWLLTLNRCLHVQAGTNEQLGWQDSNLRPPGYEPGELPLLHTPISIASS